MKLPLAEEKIFTNPIDIYSYSSDASFYRYIPSAVVQPETIEEIAGLMLWCKNNKSHLTFRAAGTSLSGQTQTNGILVDITKHFRKVEIVDNGFTVIAEPGVIGGKINDMLKKFGRKLGPDPASINSCMVGGMVANNSSGMSSGIERNLYHTIKSLKYILPSGLVVDSKNKNSNEYLQKFSTNIFNGLLEIKNRIIKNDELRNKIIKKYEIKNTIGYSLNAFIDFDKPIDILTHLLVGSEGTLGFISEVEFETYPDYNNKLTGLIIYQDIKTACDSIIKIKQTGTTALEIMDYTSIKSVMNLEGVPKIIREIPENGAALLFEYQELNNDFLAKKRYEFENAIRDTEYFSKPWVTYDAVEQARIWNIRKGLLPSLGAARKPGTTFILEDLCFRPEQLGQAIPELQELFRKYEFYDAGIYGHGLDGNIHFMLTMDLSKQSSISKLDGFMNEMAELVVNKFTGSLKAEHGTGRNMAPFVQLEWGNDGYEVMKSIKKLIDPDNILNPGVIINDDKKIHLKNIKSIPVTGSEIDKCIECGFCENKCPSRDLTLSPRKRIAIIRENHFRKLNGNKLDISQNDFNYYVADTCAVDGICGYVCPVGINTGEEIKIIRSNNNKKLSRYLYLLIERNFGIYEKIVKSITKLGHGIANIIGDTNLKEISKFIRKTFNTESFPFWNEYITYPAKINIPEDNSGDYVYFPCCVTRMLGKYNTNEKSVIDILISVAGKAGIKILIPRNINDFCCGTIFSSKGHFDSYRKMINKTIAEMWEWSEKGKKSIIFDSSSCSHSIKNCRDYLEENNKGKWDKLKFLDSIEFIHDIVLEKAKIYPTEQFSILHDTCSSQKAGLTEKFKKIAERCSKEVFLPNNNNCCGFAGDRGFLFPELTESATLNEKNEVKDYISYKLSDDKKIQTNERSNGKFGFYSSNVPCEIGMSSAVGNTYKSIIFLVEKAMEKRQ